MKIFAFILMITAFSVAGNTDIQAQNITIILVRHAEKDTSATAIKSDPDLNDAGRKRAERLSEILFKYKPRQIFSTRYRRTRMSAEPLANSIFTDYRLQTQIYDFDEPEAFAAELLSLKTKCVVVFGHSNTTPALANLLLKQSKYKDLTDAEYDKIFIIKVKKDRITDEVITY
jgi:2,3-bisphosphoglycerate-dependent phosphoglycerate mutase